MIPDRVDPRNDGNYPKIPRSRSKTKVTNSALILEYQHYNLVSPRVTVYQVKNISLSIIVTGGWVTFRKQGKIIRMIIK